MWVIGIVVCAGLMLGGHAVMNTGHGSHSHTGAATPADAARGRAGWRCGGGRAGERAAAGTRISQLKPRNER